MIWKHYLSLLSCLLCMQPIGAHLETFASLVAKSELFSKSAPFATYANLIKVIAKNNVDTQQQVARQANDVHPIISPSVVTLIQDYLEHKRKYGSSTEADLYAHMDVSAFFDRLLIKRPLMFMTENDTYMLRDGKQGCGGFEAIGTQSEHAPLLLREYLSYDEMQIAALIGVAVPTYFINNGNRFNRGITSKEGTYQKEGVYTGLVGARFEKPGLMEWQHMIVTPEQNRAENGYGADADPANIKTKLLALWQKFYGERFATYDQVVNDTTGRFYPVNGETYLDSAVYKKRMKMVIEPFLCDANERGKLAGKKVYCHAVGLGLGVWQITSEQARLMLEVYQEILSQRNFAHIADIDFSWFPPEYADNAKQLCVGNNDIALHYSKRNPADILQHDDAEKLLVAMYAWDSNAYPGNEYWAGYLNASGDPAAASCSTIVELQNPLINSNVSFDQVRMYE